MSNPRPALRVGACRPGCTALAACRDTKNFLRNCPPHCAGADAFARRAGFRRSLMMTAQVSTSVSSSNRRSPVPRVLHASEVPTIIVGHATDIRPTQTFGTRHGTSLKRGSRAMPSRRRLLANRPQKSNFFLPIRCLTRLGRTSWTWQCAAFTDLKICTTPWTSAQCTTHLKLAR
jgi:hypothetical protein